MIKKLMVLMTVVLIVGVTFSLEGEEIEANEVTEKVEKAVEIREEQGLTMYERLKDETENLLRELLRLVGVRVDVKVLDGIMQNVILPMVLIIGIVVFGVKGMLREDI